MPLPHRPCQSFMHRRAVACELCGGQFFPSSLPFHQKQCVVKQQFVELPCPFCDTSVRSWQMGQHISRECKKKNRSSPITTPPIVESNGQRVGGGVPCSVCGRRFTADRLGKHQVICRAQNDSKRSTPEIVPARPSPRLTAVPSTQKRPQRSEMREFIKQQQKKNNQVQFELVLKDHSEKFKESCEVEWVDQTVVRRRPSFESLYELDSLEGISPKIAEPFSSDHDRSDIPNDSLELSDSHSSPPLPYFAPRRIGREQVLIK